MTSVVQRAADNGGTRAPMLVSKTWAQAVALVMVFGFFVMGVLAYRTYLDHSPGVQAVLPEPDDDLHFLF